MKTFKKLAVTVALTTALMGASTMALAADNTPPDTHDGVSSLLMLITAHEVQPTVYAAYDLGVRKLQEARQVFINHGSYIAGDNALMHVQENVKYKVGAINETGGLLSVWVKIKNTTANPNDTQGKLIKLTMIDSDTSDASNFTCTTNLDESIENTDGDSTVAAIVGSPSVLLPACIYRTLASPNGF